MASIGENIRNARKSAGLTQTELALKTQLSRSYIGDIEKDRYNPSVATLKSIAAATNVPTEQLLTENTSLSTPPLTDRDERDIQKRLQAILNDLEPKTSTIDHNGPTPLDEETRDLIYLALESSLRAAKQIADAKSTHKKYRQIDDIATRIGNKILEASPSAQIAVSQIIDKDRGDGGK